MCICMYVCAQNPRHFFLPCRVKQGIAGAKSRGPGYTIGNSARAIVIPLGVHLSGGREDEWSDF